MPPARARFRLHVVTEPERLYFGHMTVYPDGHKERLHGHNARIFVDLDLADGAMARMVDLDQIRLPLGALCDAWRERLLLPAKNPFLEIVRDDGDELEFRLCGARYVCPRGDVVLLPIENCSVEGLAEHVAHHLRDAMAAAVAEGNVLGFEVRVEELPGIGASHYLALA
ncbi:MAG: 6-carboxytetrahydropterin synthase [Kofleriaceae bacterium]|nr:6-carboxytetrahydropterin synthase [Myxococcales bacterium]MCB9574267.1 6-carboxytetrahydropterin synthase [Kofleriaceae bacterium]